MSTTLTGDAKPHHQRLTRGKLSQVFEPQRLAQDAHSHGRPDRYSPPTITVRGKSPLRQEKFADSDSTTHTDRRTEIDVDERRHDDVHVYEQLVQWRNDTTKEFISAPAPSLPSRQPLRTPPTAVDNNDLEVKNDVPVTARCESPVTKRKSVMTALPMSDDGDVSATINQEQETVPLYKVSDENLKLLEKLVAGGSLTFDGAVVAVEVPKKRLHVGGNAEQIRTAKMKALETLSGICCDRAGISQKLLQLLTSDRGQQWLDDLLAQNGGPVVMLYIKDGTVYIAAADDNVISQTKSVLKKSLATETISFGPKLSKFLKSKQWADAVAKYESLWFLCVTRDDIAGKVVLDGCKRAVKDVGDEVRQLLKQNSKVNRKTELKSGEYRFIEQHLRDEIDQCLKNQQG